MVLAAAKWVGSEQERKRRGLLCLCGKQSPADEKCWQGSIFWETCKNLLPAFYLWVLPWLLMERNETQKVEGGRQTRGWKKWGKQSQQPSIWEDLLLKVLIAYPAAYTACSNICSGDSGYLLEESSIKDCTQINPPALEHLSLHFLSGKVKKLANLPSNLSFALPSYLFLAKLFNFLTLQIIHYFSVL